MAERPEPELGELREAIASVAAAEAPGLVAEARAEARARVRSMLSEAIARELLEHSADELGAATTPSRGAAPHAGAPSARPPAARAGRTAEREKPVQSSRPSPAEPPAAAKEGDTGLYVYGVTHDRPEAAECDGIPGVDGAHPTRRLRHAGLAAIVSEVPLTEFGEEPLTESLNDVEWLEKLARAHEQVLDEALGQASVVPMRLCTIYSGEAPVREMLERERAQLGEALDRLAGKTEWGVKVIADPGVLEEAVAEDGEPPGGSEPRSSGAAYIDARRREARIADGIEETATAWADEIHSELAKLAGEGLRNPLQSPELAGYEGEMLLNGVYLVDDRRGEAFGDRVMELADRWAERGVSVELTGPWPPYNFVKNSIEAAR